MVLLEVMAVVEQNALLRQLVARLFLFGEQIVTLPLELLQMVRLNFIQLAAVGFAVGDELFALFREALALAEQSFVQLFQLGFEVQARRGAIGQRLLLRRNARLALVQRRLELRDSRRSWSSCASCTCRRCSRRSSSACCRLRCSASCRVSTARRRSSSASGSGAAGGASGTVEPARCSAGAAAHPRTTVP
jgi:hypothetical protein